MASVSDATEPRQTAPVCRVGAVEVLEAERAKHTERKSLSAGLFYNSAYGLGWQTSLTRKFPAGNRAKHLPLSSSFGWGGVTVVFTFPCPHRSGRYLVDGFCRGWFAWVDAAYAGGGGGVAEGKEEPQSFRPKLPISVVFIYLPSAYSINLAIYLPYSPSLLHL